MTTLMFGLNNLFFEVDKSSFKECKYIVAQHDGWHISILGGSNKPSTAYNILNECYEAGWPYAAVYTLESLYESFLAELLAADEARGECLMAAEQSGLSVVEYNRGMFLKGAAINRLHCPRGCSKLIFLDKDHWETNEICERINDQCDDRAYRMDYNSVILPQACVLRVEPKGVWIGRIHNQYFDSASNWFYQEGYEIKVFNSL